MPVRGTIPRHREDRRGHTDLIDPIDPDFVTDYIDLGHLNGDAKSAEEFDDRTAAAIYALATHHVFEDDSVVNAAGLLAKIAYSDYFHADHRDQRAEALTFLLDKTVPARAGTGENLDGNYDFTLPYYIALVYRYHSLMSDDLREHMIHGLMANASRTAMFYPDHQRYVSGPRVEHEDLYMHIHPIVEIVDLEETENHLLLIETEKYLINQLLYQQEMADAAAGGYAPNHDRFDNNRNGRPDDGIPAVTVWILNELANLLRNDFQEYNGRPYQQESIKALLTLATYAYDDRVLLAARMVLDYISAKVAVSSNDLRRVPPFRRRNEESKYGPADKGYLETPLVFKDHPYPGSHEPDPLISFYTQLAGFTRMLSVTTGSEGFSYPKHLDRDWAEQMAYAGLCDYRVPPSILDLFLTTKNRRFLQRLHHCSNPGHGADKFADELYAGSPSYLITAGGHPTQLCYWAHVPVSIDLLIVALTGPYFGLPYAIAGDLAGHLKHGKPTDIGAAMPTSFMPTGRGSSLGEMIQFGKYTADVTSEAFHMGVAPDFACGDDMYLPASIDPSWTANDPTVISISDPNAPTNTWIFVDRQASSQDRPGYFLAIYRAPSDHDHAFCGFLEAYDTWAPYDGLAPLSFPTFQDRVRRANPSINLQIGSDQVNSYVMLSGQQIQFTISPHSKIVTSDSVFVAPLSDRPLVGNEFASGTIIHSAQGSAYVTITNPALQQRIALDMQDPLHPVRTSESGQVERAGVPYEVWVNFNYTGPGNGGDFGDPFKTLAEAVARVADGGRIKIMPGTTRERSPIRHGKRITMVAPAGGVSIGVA